MASDHSLDSSLSQEEKTALRRREKLKSSTWDWSLINIRKQMRESPYARRQMMIRLAWTSGAVLVAGAGLAFWFLR